MTGNKRFKQAGFSLVELMVAMVIGVVLVGGALTVHVQSHEAHTFAERMARIQENSRFVFDVMAPDVRLAGFWGRTEAAASIARRTGDAVTPMPAALAPAGDCYPGYYTNVVARIEAADEDHVGAANPFLACVPDSVRVDGSDILVVRHAASTATLPANIVPNRLYVISNVISGELFVGGVMPIPGGYNPTDTIHEVVTNLYYLSKDSSAGVGVPALNRIELIDGPDLADQELITGVEDLQVQLGIDTTADGSVNSYVSPDSPLLASGPIMATRAWIRIRGERVDLDFTDTSTYEYADLSIEPDDSFRRMLVSKTLRVRNR